MLGGGGAKRRRSASADDGSASRSEPSCGSSAKEAELSAELAALRELDRRREELAQRRCSVRGGSGALS